MSHLILRKFVLENLNYSTLRLFRWLLADEGQG